MLIFTTIFTLAVSLLFLLSGVAKFFSLKETIESVVKMNIFSKRIALIIGIFLPLIEIIIAVAMFFFSDNLLIVILALILIVIFAAINFKAVLDGNQADCNCFGKLLKTKTGYGGLLQCLLLLLSLIPSFIWSSSTFSVLIEFAEFIEVTVCSLLWTATLILFRRIIEILYPSSSQH